MCVAYFKYPVLESIREIWRIDAHTGSGQVSGGGFKGLAQRERESVEEGKASMMM